MANTVYDPDADEKYDSQHLKSAEERASQDSYDREFNNIASHSGDTAEHPLGANETGTKEKSASSDELKESEEGASTGGSTSSDDTLGKGYTANGTSKKRRFLGKARHMSRARKWALIAGASSGLGVIGFIIFLFILASSLKIPNLMQNITTYEFARMTRQYAQSANRVTTEKLAADTLSDESWSKLLKDKYQNLRNNTWGKFDSYRPNIVMKNLVSENNFKLNYKTTSWLKRPQLIGVTLGDQTYLKVQQSAATRFIPGLSSIIDFKNNVSLSKQLVPALDAGLRDKDIGPIIRGAVAKKIRQQLGIGLVAWTLGKFKGKTLDPEAPPSKSADVAETEERTQTVDQAAMNGENNARTDEIKNGVEDAKSAEQTAAASDSTVAQAIKDGGVFQSVKDAIGSAVKVTGLDTAVSFINPVYGAALPMCIVYDGSLDRSGPTIDQQTTEQAATYYHYASAADELKSGVQTNDPDEATELGLAAGATSDSLGDTDHSNAIIRASGGTVDTHNTPSAESSADGQFTLLDATPIIGRYAGVIDTVANSLCPYLTQLDVAAGIGILNILVSIGAGGTDIPEEEAAGEVVSTVAENIAKQAIEDSTQGIISKTVSGAVSRFGKLLDVTKDTAKSAGKIALITIAAKIVVNMRAGQVNSGVSQSTDAANVADAGGNVVANMQEQQQLYGRPMTQDEVAQSDQADQQYITALNSSKSLYERYFATDNAGSLLSRMATSVSGDMNTSFLHTLVNFASLLLKPMTYFGSFMSSFSGHVHAAALDSYHYGNVQFGWSSDEENLIDSNESYHSSLENQARLDNMLVSEQPYGPTESIEDYISNNYDYCFSDTIGDLLSKGYIMRDPSGNVIADQGDCSPDNLGVNSPLTCGFQGENAVPCADWIFRYRLTKQYGNTTDQLLDTQTVGTDTSTSSSTTGNTATGDAATLAQQVLNNSNITLSSSAKADLAAAAQNNKIMPGPIGNGSSGLPGCSARTPTNLNPTLLQVMLNIAQKYQYQINDIVSGHDCDTGQHPLGRAMDIFYISGQPLDDAWWSVSSNVATVNDIGNIVHNTASSQFGFGVGCTATSKIQSRGNLVVFNDSCNPQDEIHIDVRGAP